MKMKVWIAVVLFVFLSGCHHQIAKSIEDETTENDPTPNVELKYEQMDKQLKDEQEDFINWDHLIKAAKGLYMDPQNVVIHVPSKTEEELQELSKDKDNQDYGLVVKRFIREEIGKKS